MLGGSFGNPAYELLKSKQLYVANNYLEDTCEYKIVSMKISSTQCNYQYELKSNNDKLTPEIVDFVIRANKNFYISVKAMNIQTGITKRLKPLEIDVYTNGINRTKQQLLKSKKLDLISSSSKLKITSFNLYKNMYQNEEDFMASSSNKLTKEMKTYIKTLEIGDVVRFSIEYTDILGENKNLYLDVRIVE